MISTERRGVESAKWRGFAARGTVWAVALVVSAVLADGGAAASAEPLDALAGVWRDAIVLEQHGLDIAPGDLDRTITVSAAGVALRRATADRGTIEITLVGSGRAGVLQPAPASDGLFSRLFPPGQGSPLDGDRLIWARVDGASLVVYGLAIDGTGHYTIEQERQTREGEQLRVELLRLRLGEEPARLVAMLMRRKG